MKITVGKKPFPRCETDIHVEPVTDAHGGELEGMFTLSLYSGSAYLQTYLCRADLVSMANGLLALAEMSEVKA